MRHKSSELEVFLHNEKYPNIVCVTETWLRTDEALCFKLNNYHTAASFCRKDTRAGGVAVYLHSDIVKFTTLDLKEIAVERNFEATAAFVEISRNIKFVVCCLYRSPTSVYNLFCKQLEKLLVYLSKHNVSLIICGDFNYNFILNTKEITNVVNIFSSYGLLQSFHDPSRMQGSSCTLIDNMFTNLSATKTKTVDLTFSDHNGQFLYFSPGEFENVPKLSPKLKRSFSPENVNHFNFLLHKENWILDMQALDNAGKFTHFFSTFRELFEVSFPYTCKKQNNNNRHNPWITEAIVNEGRELRELCARVKSTNNPNLRELYRSKQKEHKRSIALAKRTFNSDKIRESNNVSKAAWAVINSNTDVKQRKKGVPDKITLSENVEVTNQDDIACAFNSHFVESIKKLLSSTAVPQTTIAVQSAPICQTIFLAPLTEYDVMDIIRSISGKSSAGYDEIPCDLIIKCTTNILTPLTYLINFSFEHGFFPQELNQAIIVPIHKKGTMSSVENYRPIALLSVFSKIFEKAFKKRLISFLVTFRVLNCEQFGFRVGLSTVDAILSFYIRILNNFNEKLRTLGVFFDFKKAFDTINHKILLEKLAHYGIRGSALEWLRMYLSGRTQAVRLSGFGGTVFSDWIGVEDGVPQGSVLGPILFLLFINDLPLAVGDGHVTLFADDTSAVVSAGDCVELCRRAGRCVSDIAEWCNVNGLFLNGQKTNFMVFTPVGVVQDRSLLVMNDSSSLHQLETTTFLGVVIDHHLSWKAHIDKLCARLSSRNYAVLRLRDFVDVGTLKMFYYAMVHSVLAYGVLAWGNSSNVGRVLLSQKRIVRSMFKLNFRQSCRDTFKSQKIPTVVNIYILQCACYVFKRRNDFKRFGDVNQYMTRNSEMLYIPGSRLTQVQDGPEITSLKIYNHLPDHLKCLNVEHKFKAGLKKILAQHPFYTLSEFFRCDAF